MLVHISPSFGPNRLPTSLKLDIHYLRDMKRGLGFGPFNVGLLWSGLASLTEQFLQGNVPYKGKLSLWDLMEICHQRSKWMGLLSFNSTSIIIHVTSKCHSKFILWVGRDGPNVSHLSKSHDVFEIWCLTGGFYLFLMRVLNCLLIIVIIILIYWHIISTHTGRNNLSMSILKVVISNCKCNVYFITLYLVKTTEYSRFF